ncbi:hypothetical protein C7S18_18950 [Ahniella affigens]|uniref:Pycsar effector protein domain-containing protein n=1 Tax=Ahniella affigens TaxID=2021234 RepID=A0A2P1PWA8_9GAMM|nr:Pycsar system effector family protein [Ahniella affigens]AVP99119.1 hypothetical protein C7S18_18950 [Ahniella affigens]
MSTEQPSTSDSIAGPFLGVVERNTADNLLRTCQQHHVQMSTLADTKANIIITVSSIVMSLALGRLNDPTLMASAATLLVFTLLALLLAILAVLPKFRRFKQPDGPLPSDFNLFFFGHFSGLNLDRFEREVASQLDNDGRIYRAMTRDVYGLGTYLAVYKYPYLRWSYLFFLSGFIVAAVVQGLVLLQPVS